jgi:hypothetical protein
LQPSLKGFTSWCQSDTTFAVVSVLKHIDVASVRKEQMIGLPVRLFLFLFATSLAHLYTQETGVTA